MQFIGHLHFKTKHLIISDPCYGYNFEKNKNKTTIGFLEIKNIKRGKWRCYIDYTEELSSYVFMHLYQYNHINKNNLQTNELDDTITIDSGEVGIYPYSKFVEPFIPFSVPHDKDYEMETDNITIRSPNGDIPVCVKYKEFNAEVIFIKIVI